MTYGTSTEILSFRRFFVDGLAGKCWRSFHLDPRRQCAVWFCVSRVTKITAFHIFHGLWRGIGDRAEILPHWTRLVDARKKFVLATPWAEGLAEPSPDVMKFFFFSSCLSTSLGSMRVPASTDQPNPTTHCRCQLLACL